MDSEQGYKHQDWPQGLQSSCRSQPPAQLYAQFSLQQTGRENPTLRRQELGPHSLGIIGAPLAKARQCQSDTHYLALLPYPWSFMIYNHSLPILKV